jgi:hypothetical protein
MSKIVSLTPLDRDIHRKAKTLLLLGWTTGAYARDAAGVACDPWDMGRAKRWDFIGSLIGAEHMLGLDHLTAREGAEVLIERRLGMRVSTWNDLPTTTLESILELIETMLREGK